MIGRKQRAAALAVLVAAHRRYGFKSFVVDPCGSNYRPLKDAESLGWGWFNGPRFALTDAGLREVEGYHTDRPRAVVSYVCPVCLSTVSQPAGDTGLPVNTPCPTCEAATLAAAERFRTEHPA